MALIRYKQQDPISALESLHDEMDTLFNWSWGNLPLKTLKESFAPAVDMWEDENNIYVEADLPGIEQKDISVKVKDEALIISAKKEQQKEEKKKNYHYYERFSGNFYRAIGLPTSVDTNKIVAKYKSGVLNVTLPKKEEKKEKAVDITIE